MSKEILVHTEVIDKLKTLTKEELIDFIGTIKHCYRTSEFNNYIYIVKCKRKQRLNDQLYSNVKAADDLTQTAIAEYTNYMTDLTNEYGKNGILYFKYVPDAKILKLLELKKIVDNAINNSQAAYKNWQQRTK